VTSPIAFHTGLFDTLKKNQSAHVLFCDLLREKSAVAQADKVDATTIFRDTRQGAFLAAWQTNVDPQNRLLSRLVKDWPGMTNLDALGRKLVQDASAISGLQFSYLLQGDLKELQLGRAKGE
jgi:hypothetical protein